MRRSKRITNLRVLPGEPLDGSGRVCIHLFVRDEKGSFVEPHVLHLKLDADGKQIGKQLEARPTRGRLACNAKRNPAPKTVGNVTTVTPRTDDPRAVTCPKCIASDDYKKLMGQLEATTT